MMKMNRLLPLVIAALLAACVAPEEPPPEAKPQLPDQIAPEFQGGGQISTDKTIPYAAEPYGVGVGSVVPNYEFLGFPRASLEKSTLKKIMMADFYNPTGTDVWPAGSPYGGGTAKPKALVLDRSAVWCAPCNYEAKNELPGKRLTYGPKGGEFIVFLDDGPTPGTPATQNDILGWVTKYNVDYPAILNPAATLSAIVGVDAYPGHVIVRTRDMKIVKWTAGVPDAAFWTLFDDTLAGKAVLPGD
jgi:hypothetical protein